MTGVVVTDVVVTGIVVTDVVVTGVVVTGVVITGGNESSVEASLYNFHLKLVVLLLRHWITVMY